MIHLHTHTKYSLLDATIDLKSLAERLNELGQNAIAITEHGNMYSAVEAYSILNKYHIKAITGCEVYICDDVLTTDKNNKYSHLILLCKNEQGRINLQKMVSESSLHKYYGKPRIDFEMLSQHHTGLICLSACMAGEVSKALQNGNSELAKQIASKYKNLFGEDYYIEFQAHANEEQQRLNMELIHLAEQLNIDYVVTCDAHYLNKADQKYHDIFVRIGSMREAGEIYDDCYIQSEEEVIANCWLTSKYVRQAIRNTHIIADRCVNTVPLSAPIIPHCTIPENFKTEVEYLQYLSNRGFKEKGFSTWNKEQWTNYLTEVSTDINGNTHSRLLIPFNTAKEIRNKYIERAKYEMHFISKMGFEGYYLLVHSYVTSVQRRGIARGSGGGSLIAYLSGIVDIDPIKYGLYFERFIDVGALDLLERGAITRKELKIPDFDVDFGTVDRGKVVQAIVRQYGQENVVSLGQFSYLHAKGIIKDIGKVLGIPFEITNEITKHLSNETIEQALDFGLLDDYKGKYPELFDYCVHLQGLPKSFGVHPCGKCICMREAQYYNATEYSETNDEWVLQGDMHTADDLGLVKIDLLGLRTLDVNFDILDMINKDYEYIAPHKINMNDVEVWNEFSKGNTDCIFQFESDGMKRTLIDMKCNTIENLSAANALYRPGSKDYIPNYINRKNGKESITYLHPDLESILSNSYGIIVFQEQLIEIGRLAGLHNPDELRKATAKKKADLMAKIEPELKSGLMKRGWVQNQVDQLWNDILKFARYSFNKSHSSAYALTAYISMFLKVHHTKEFFTACINSYKGDIGGVVKAINEGRRMGVTFKFKNWRNANADTECGNDCVYLGYNTIKGCGDKVSVGLLEIAETVNPKTFLELVQAVNDGVYIDKTQFKTLIKHNFFKEFGSNGSLLKLYNLYDTINSIKILKKNNLKGLDEDVVKMFSKETLSQYRITDKQGLLNYYTRNVPDLQLPLKYMVCEQVKDFGYVNICDKKYRSLAAILDVDTRYSPKILAYDLKNGKTYLCKVSKKNYSNCVVNKGDLIQVNKTEMKPKSVPDGNGGWIKDTKQVELWITNYIQIR